MTIPAISNTTRDRERQRWERLAANPYYAVINQTRFRGVPGEERRREFFASGEDDIRLLFEDIHRYVEPGFRPRRSLDFGCGVGRLVLPLARRSGDVIGVDIAAPMLAEAQRNCELHGVSNVRFQLSAMLTRSPGPEDTADLVHSYIVLQHVPPPLGEEIVRQLLARLRREGVGALHLTFQRRASVWRRAINRARSVFAPLNMLANVIQGRPAREPQMSMYCYDHAKLAAIVQQCGCRIVHERPTAQGSYVGAILFVRRIGDG